MIGFHNFLDLVHPVVKSENINNSEKVTEKAVGRRKKLIGIKDHKIKYKMVSLFLNSGAWKRMNLIEGWGGLCRSWAGLLTVSKLAWIDDFIL